MNDQKKFLPHFIIIGAMKAGTTSLFEYLKIHPEISMSKIKETNFFIETHFKKGIDWYKNQFPDDDKIKGEACTNYTKYPANKGVPKRIYQTIPQVKLIYILRDPIERVLSHVHHSLLKGNEDEQNYQAKLYHPNNHYINCSRYYMQLEQYLPYFSKNKILMLTAEELKKDTKGTLQKIFSFLELTNPDFYSKEYEKKKHTSSGRRKIKNTFIRNALKDKPYYNFVASKLNFIIPSREIPKPDIPQDLYKHLKAVFKEDIGKLKAFTGRSFEEWKHKYD
jgi:hypothetical protein